MPESRPERALRALTAALQKLPRWGVRAAGMAALIVVIFAGGLYLLPTLLGWMAPPLDLPRNLYALNRPVAFTFLDVEGHEVGQRGAIVGKRLTLDEMPAYLPAAFVAMEDRRFYEHGAIDMRGLLRAAWANWKAGHVVQGGSTISQQLAKILFLTPDRTYARKYREMLDAFSLENTLSKKEILTLYLNRIYLGAGAYGVDGAAHVYFDKPATRLSLAEAAMLATLTRAPSAFSPRRDLAKAQARADVVLDTMVETGAITKAEADKARAHPATIVSHATRDARNYFLDAAADEARRVATIKGDRVGRDLIVRTTMEPALQETARKALVRHLKKSGRKLHVKEGAVVVMKPDGAVSALIGGRDYDDSVFNRATKAKRQPGSAFKPFVYLAAVENGISPWDTREDGPVDIDGWQPTNYGNRSYGIVTVADALARSINTVTAELAQEVGIDTVIRTARACGITSPLAANASLALGTSEVTPLELTTAYATFASGGILATPYFVTEVQDMQGHILYRRNPPQKTRVIPQYASRDLNAMLFGVVDHGTGRRAALKGYESAGKTGTTQDYHDAWYMGYTNDYVTGVWVGNDHAAPMKGVTGGTLPAEIWHDVMTVAMKGMAATPIARTAPPPPEDEDWDSPYATSDAAPGYDPYARERDTRQARSHRHERSFFDWLFGRDSADNDDEAPRHAETRNQSQNRMGPRNYGDAPPVDERGAWR